MILTGGLFLVASLTINAIPGADVVYVTGKYYTKGKRSAVLSATGLAVGYYFYYMVRYYRYTSVKPITLWSHSINWCCLSNMDGQEYYSVFSHNE